MSEAERRVGAVHEALAGDADICIELHRQMNPAESIALGQRLQKFHPYFYEDPMLPDSPAMMADVQARSGLPVATGERFVDLPVPGAFWPTTAAPMSGPTSACAWGSPDPRRWRRWPRRTTSR